MALSQSQKEYIENGTVAGQMAFWNGSKWVRTETDELFWDDVNKRFGIGESSPDAKMHIAGSVVVGNGSAGVNYYLKFVGLYYTVRTVRKFVDN